MKKTDGKGFLNLKPGPLRMNDTVKKTIRIFLKILLWLIVSLTGISLLLIVLIQIPAVQNFAVQKVIKVISQKTGTNVELHSIRIQFPKQIVLDQLFIEDKLKDTLLYAENLNVNVNLLGLIKKDLTFSDITLTNAFSHIYRNENDTSFNYSVFLSKDKSDSAAVAIKTDTASKPMQIKLGDITLNNIRFNFEDFRQGKFLKVELGSLTVDWNDFNLDKSLFDINKVSTEHLKISMVQTKEQPRDTSPPSIMPDIRIEKIKLKDIEFSQIDKTLHSSIQFSLKDVETDIKKVSLPDAFLKVGDLNVDGLVFINQSGKTIITDSTNVKKNDQLTWKVWADNTRITNSHIKLDQETNRIAGLDPNHLDITELNVTAENLRYDSSSVYLAITNLNLKEASGLNIQELKVNANLKMDAANGLALDLNNLYLQTPVSRIQNKLSISYVSAESLKNSPGEMKLDVNLQSSQIGFSDILIFQPELAKKSYFKKNQSIGINTRISGKLKQLTIQQFEINQGASKISTQGSITDLPNPVKTTVNFPKLTAVIDPQLINNFQPDSFPLKITDAIHLNASLRGNQNNFEINLKAISKQIEMEIASIRKTEEYKGTVHISNVNIASLLADTNTFGMASMNLSFEGTIDSANKTHGQLTLDIPHIDFKKYNYSNITAQGAYTNHSFDGQFAIDDTNLALVYNGLIDVAKGNEIYAFDLNLKGINLKNLNLNSKDIRLSAQASAEITGGTINTINGKAGITKLIFVKDKQSYSIDSLLFASVNEKGKSDLSLESPIIAANFKGNFSPGDLIKTIKQEINRRFYLGDTTDNSKIDAQNFSFNLKIRNNPILKEIIFPELGRFSGIEMSGSLDSQAKKMELALSIPYLEYGTTKLDSISLNISNRDTLIANFSVKEVYTSGIKLINTNFLANVDHNIADLKLTMRDTSRQEKFILNSKLISENGKYKWSISPEGLLLNKSTWSIPRSNQISIDSNLITFKDFTLSSNEQFISIQSNPAEHATIISFKNFDLATITGLMEKDTVLASGIMNGQATLFKSKGKSGFTAQLAIDQMKYKLIPIGDIKITAGKKTDNIYNLDLGLSGNENEVHLAGNYSALDSNSTINFKLDLNKLTIQSAEAFSGGQLKNSTGYLQGSLALTGTTKQPVINGDLIFNQTAFHSTTINNYLSLENEKIKIENNKVAFNNFTIRDSLGNPGTVNGYIDLADYKVYGLNLDLRFDQFTALNTTKNENKLFYGKLKLNSFIHVSGTSNLPEITAKLKLLDESNLTIVIPEEKSIANKGEGTVVFIDPRQTLSPILTAVLTEQKSASEIKGLNISSTIEIDKNSLLKIIVDPTSGDSLVISGNATLSFGISPGGKLSLTGTYAVTDGSYRVSFRDLIKKSFSLTKGSTITWNGDPLDADLNIKATYVIKTSPIDLVADQLTGVSDQERNKFRQKLPFNVYLELNGALLKPEISFAIDLPPEYRGSMGGAVYAKLNQLKQDPSELNKQVFSLLLLGRFMQQDPLASSGSGGGFNSVARNSVSKVLSDQLNRLSDKYVKGVELNFDVESYDDYSTGNAQAKTEVGIGLKKQLFDERVSVSVGSTVGLGESAAATNQNGNNVASDVTIEYKITNDGRYRLKGFRQNQFFDVLEGQLNITGVGLIYNRDFNFWKELIHKPKQTTDEYLND